MLFSIQCSTHMRVCVGKVGLGCRLTRLYIRDQEMEYYSAIESIMPDLIGVSLWSSIQESSSQVKTTTSTKPPTQNRLKTFSPSVEIIHSRLSSVHLLLICFFFLFPMLKLLPDDFVTVRYKTRRGDKLLSSSAKLNSTRNSHTPFLLLTQGYFNTRTSSPFFVP